MGECSPTRAPSRSRCAIPAAVPQQLSTPCPMLTERFVPVGYGVSEGAVGLAASWKRTTQASWSRRSQTRMRRDLSPRAGPRPRVVAAAAKGMGAAPRSAEKAPRRSAWTRHAMAAGHGRDQPRDRRGACTTSRRPRTGRTRPELRARDSADRQPSRSFWRWAALSKRCCQLGGVSRRTTIASPTGRSPVASDGRVSNRPRATRVVDPPPSRLSADTAPSAVSTRDSSGNESPTL